MDEKWKRLKATLREKREHYSNSALGASLTDMTAFHHARTKRARAQKSDRPASERALFGQAHTYG